MQDASALKRSLLIFSLVHAELKWLIQYLQEQCVKREHPDIHFSELVEGTLLSLTMELKKVMQRELPGTAALQQYELIFARIQNSQGILLNSLQQIIISLAQYFDPHLEGHEIFPDYVTRLEQSLKLRSDLYSLLELVKEAQKEQDLGQLPELVKKIEWFKVNSMKYLMYKDWVDFDNFFHEIRTCKTHGNFMFSLHRFQAFLTALIKEVNKRSILYNHPFHLPLD